MKKVHRLRELDFLRGMAIILVLFRHFPLHPILTNMGWIGVDLFFVLSGYLVSGLLFREYKKNKKVNVSNFLIRRGFKIYPLYYLTYLLYIVPIILASNFSLLDFAGDMLFVQNYVTGWGYAYSASWSLAVEEHFYFGFAFAFWLSLKTSYFKLPIEGEKTGRLHKIEFTILSVILICILLRFVSNIEFPHKITKNFTMTHLRIDSLLAGVWIAYLYNFRLQVLKKLFEKYKFYLYIILLLGLSWTPFIEPISSFFAKTIGFSLLYVSFSILLVIFLLNKKINLHLDSFIGEKVVTFVAKIGFSSYSIYIIHLFVNSVISKIRFSFDLYYNQYLYFVIAFGISILLGMIMTYKLEVYFLTIRDRLYPRSV